MLPFRKNFTIPTLPSGFILEYEKPPAPAALNRLLSSCNQGTYSYNKLALALKKSSFCISILEEDTRNLVGFVRVTSDNGLNANLWNLAAQPGSNQSIFFSILIFQILKILRRNMPGCSISILAPSMALDALQGQGFLVDPGGIRAMGLKLR